jgi:uncharacterized protein (TIGR03435 family)
VQCVPVSRLPHGRVYSSHMRGIVKIAMVAPAVLAAAYGQTSGKAEFEVASIKINPPQPGFHFAADAATGGPGTADPGMFRCSKCSLATLIVKAFNLQPYQFPGRTSFTDNTYEIMAKIPTGASTEEFSAMLQNLLEDRFGLTWRFQEKKLKGYRLVIARDGPKLTESTGASLPPASGQHRSGQAESHNHSGPVVFGTSANYRAANQTTADLARVLSDQIGLPVDDATGLPGKYDISLRWSGTGAAPAGNHGAGAWSGGAGHAGHDGGGGDPSGTAADPSGPTLFDALQQQLGLRLVPAEQALARLFVVDRVAQRPTEN